MKSQLNTFPGSRNFLFRKKTPFGLTLVLAMALVSTAWFVFPSSILGKTSPALTPQIITYPASQFTDGKARFFQFKTHNGKTIRYFIVRSSDGVIRAAFDACDVCWPSGKGYYQDGNFMVCRNCGQRFPTPKVNVITGGCNPTALNRQLSQTRVTLRIKDIMAGLPYFNF